ncbi:sulfite exporter TauE/SafE family protein [Limnohabitans planktonicus]|uniref:Probable membrane transporter protein n=1 Tax=Limnohabitans planktonicus II-D5 TaxID=1293045 RepID=A0A2T7UFU6_9BURK|nr:sulfite exporter TauE/SafE family protein [Limnohabitans planktonicus]PVE43532.1 anion permease [Limnohabitans planktonicus II-D5]|eukprot:gene53515-65372_t
MTDYHQIILFAGGLLAGVINVVAGGAGFMTFPLLVATGLTEMEANACNFVALLPANIVGALVYRKELWQLHPGLVPRLTLAAVGGVVGSLLFVKLGAASFLSAIPWLLLFATLCFTFGPRLKKKLVTIPSFDPRKWLGVSLLLELSVFIYGGYFGLGMGIILMAIYAIFSPMNIHQANALRNTSIAIMTVIGVLVFSRSGLVRWEPALTMMAGAVIGGYCTAKIVRNLPGHIVRIAIIGWSFILTAYAFWHYW